MKNKYLALIAALIGSLVVFLLYSQQTEREHLEPSRDNNISIDNKILTPEDDGNPQFNDDGNPEELAQDQLDDYLNQLTVEEEDARPDGWSDKKWLHFVYTHRTRLKEDGIVKFYGKVIDEDDRPVEGVNIDAVILYHEPSISSILRENNANREKKIVVTTKADGWFEIDSLRGKSLTLKGFNKEGFQLEGRKYFVYDFGPRMASPHDPDRTNPVVFRMIQTP